ncbi:DUF1345 domain-containing protein [Sphingomonas bacterium]|uniref:DUF1345 domain-containing protein n=1 Tax=Sphingomonas bacterium TaxID=1895847 RepID=UPI00157620A0|nr:DUF1345 domain-containing protein [Sphingomonas bacterium]
MAFKLDLGKRIAPPRFIAFIAIFAAALVALPGPLGLGRGTMLAFDIATIVFLASVVPLVRYDNADRMRNRAKTNDANRTILLGLTFATIAVILVSIANELHAKNDKAAIFIIIATLVLAWLFTNIVYTLHYAHIYYSDEDADGQDNGGLEFPHCDTPDYWDFAYFSFTLGMTFQTSDVDMTSRTMRRVALGHCMIAFVFNIGVLAFTINVLGGGGG